MLVSICCGAADEKSASSAAAGARAQLALTEEEQRWIKENPTVRYTGDPNWLPFEAFDAEGNYSGIVD